MGIRRLSRQGLIVLAVSCLLPLSPGAAVAVEGVEPQSTAQCASGRLCLWANSLFQGSFWSTASTSIANVGFSSAGSVWNRTSKAARIYSGSTGGGTSVCVAPGAQMSSAFIASGSARVLTTAGC